MATAPASARWEKCDWKLLVDCSRDPGLNVGDPASLKEVTLGTVDKKLRIVDCGNAVSRHPLAEACRGGCQHTEVVGFYSKLVRQAERSASGSTRVRKERTGSIGWLQLLRSTYRTWRQQTVSRPSL